MSIENSIGEQSRLLDVSRTRELTVAAIGDERLGWLEQCDYRVLQHCLGTGELMLQILEANNYPMNVCRLGALGGALHDIGKAYPDPEVRAFVHSDSTLTKQQSDRFNIVHTQRGYEMLEMLAKKGLGVDRSDIMLAAFVALNHHGKIPRNYSMKTEFAFEWGITHLLRVCDATHALLFDDRAYITSREGRELTLEDRRQIILGNSFGNPVINGKEIDTDAEVRRLWIDPTIQQVF